MINVKIKMDTDKIFNFFRVWKIFPTPGRSAFVCILFFTFGIFFSLPVQAQVEPLDSAPPPLKIISKEEKKQLDDEQDVKKHTKLALELMDARLKNAENFNAQNSYRDMYNELGSFHAIMDNTLVFLNQRDSNKGKVLNNFKRLEMGLREFMPRLELIRRELPGRFEFYVRTLIKNVRDARTRAVEPLFDDSVVRDNKNKNNNNE